MSGRPKMLVETMLRYQRRLRRRDWLLTVISEALTIALALLLTYALVGGL